MNEKDFNLAILNKLIEVAKEVFDKYTTIDEGEYTTSEIVKRKNRMIRILKTKRMYPVISFINKTSFKL